jgi:membrane fusion protein (multidrug efflux system)
MSVVGLVPTGVRDESLTVPQDAVLRDDAGEYVYVDGGGRAAVVRVETLFSVDDRLVVRSTGLQPGARVVVEGHQRMFPGQPLEPVGGPGGS